MTERAGTGWAAAEVRAALDAAGTAAGYCLAVFGRRPGAETDPGAADPDPFGRLPPQVLAEMVEEVAGWSGHIPVSEATGLLPMTKARALARVRGREAPGAALRTGREPGDVEIHAVARPFVGFFALEQHRLRHRRFDGGISEEIERLVFASGDAVTVLPYDPRHDRVLLIEQFRAGPHARKDRLPWCIEAIAGRCDADESLEETVRREAREEAGLDLGRVERILGYYPTPALAAEHITSFAGEADLGGEHGVFGLATEHEDIRAFAVPRAEAMAALASGEVNNAPLALSLLWLDLNAGRLRREWVR